MITENELKESITKLVSATAIYLPEDVKKAISPKTKQEAGREKRLCNAISPRGSTLRRGLSNAS